MTTIRGQKVSGPLERALDEFDIFVRDAEAVSILEKVLARAEPSVRDMVGGDFGFDTNFNEFREMKIRRHFDPRERWRNGAQACQAIRN